jgi:hypothetical protein
MRRKQLQANNAVEAIIVEQARLFARELQRTCNQAPDGQVLDQAEGVILKQGRDFLRIALQASLQEQAKAVKKKGRRSVPARVNVAVMTKDNGREKS